MGLFGDQVLRLLREKWSSPQELAEEIFAILSADVPLNITGPVTITNNTTQPGLTIQDGAYSPAPIQIGQTPLPSTPFPPIPGVMLPPIGVPNIAFITPYLINGIGDDLGQGSGTSAFAGQIKSGGPGPKYKVSIFQTGVPSGPLTSGLNPVVVPVVQLQIDANETIPVGTWVVVFKVGANYFMQVPVWLDDLT